MIYNVLFTFCTILMTKADYNVTKFAEPILKENFGTTYLYHEEWTTLHFIDTKDIIIEATNLRQHLSKLIKLCSSSAYCNSADATQTLMTRMELLNQRLETISLLTKNSRNKRGLMNFVGKGLKFMFGTMDSDDAESISHTLDNVYDHSSKTILLVKNQTTIVKNLLLTVENYDKQREKDVNMLLNLTNNISGAINANQYNNIVLKNLFIILTNFNYLEQLITSIENSIQADHTNLISPMLITPQNFIASLAVIDKSSPKNMLFSISLPNYHLFTKLSTISILLYKSKIIYKVTTAIPSTIEYTTIKITSIPVATWNNYYIYTNLIGKYTAISKDKTEYTMINYETCKRMNQINYCKISYPIFKMTNHVCLFNLLTSETDVDCERKYFSLQQDYIKTLDNGYTWYILPFHALDLSINCKNSSFHTTVNTPSLLTLGKHCQAQSDSYLFIPIFHNNDVQIEQHHIRFNFSKEEEFYFSQFKLQPKITHTHIDLEDLKHNTLSLQASIDAYEDTLTESRVRSFKSTATSFIQTAGYIALIIIFITILYRLKWLKWCTTPFKFAFNICFDSRPSVPRTLEQHVHSTSTPTSSIIKYTPVSDTVTFSSRPRHNL